MTRSVDVVTTYLEMLAPGELRPSQRQVNDFSVLRVGEPSPEYARFLYTAVGGYWYWIDRMDWTYGDWQGHVTRKDVEIWVGYVNGAPCGYFELEHGTGSVVQILYFGLLPGFFGRGLGGQLLTVAIERAWASGARRVWVNTCTLDGAAALANYQARGFKIYRQHSETRELADSPPGPWPGARAPLIGGTA